MQFNNAYALLLLSLPLIVPTVMAFPIGPPSYSCDTQLSRVEQLICDSDELSYVDRNFSVIYQYSVEQWPVQDGVDVREAQRSWLGQRNQCETVECVGAMYLERTSVLKPANLRNYGSETYTYWARSRFWNQHTHKTWSEFEYLIGPYARPEVRKDFEFVHGSGPDYPICQEFIEMLNAHEDKSELVCGLPDFEGHPDFSAPPMRELSFEEVEELHGTESAGYRRTVQTNTYIGNWDLNHDGIDDVIETIEGYSNLCVVGNGNMMPYSSIAGQPSVISPFATEEFQRIIGRHSIDQYLVSNTDIIGGSFEEDNHYGTGRGALFLYDGRGYTYDGLALSSYLLGKLPANDSGMNLEIRDFKDNGTSTVCLIKIREN